MILGSGSEVQPHDLPQHFHTLEQAPSEVPQVTASGLSFRDVVDDFEANLILQALEQTQWNKKAAARLLGLNRTTLVEKIRKKGLEHGQH